MWWVSRQTSCCPVSAFACSACFAHLFPLLVAWSNWSIPIFPTESFIVHTADLSAFAGCSAIPLHLLKLIIGDGHGEPAPTTWPGYFVNVHNYGDVPQIP